MGECGHEYSKPGLDGLLPQGKAPDRLRRQPGRPVNRHSRQSDGGGCRRSYAAIDSATLLKSAHFGHFARVRAAFFRVVIGLAWHQFPHDPLTLCHLSGTLQP
jgi:hypothetical protein